MCEAKPRENDMFSDILFLSPGRSVTREGSSTDDLNPDLNPDMNNF